jgi:hypothetical protein
MLCKIVGGNTSKTLFELGSKVIGGNIARIQASPVDLVQPYSPCITISIASRSKQMEMTKTHSSTYEPMPLAYSSKGYKLQSTNSRLSSMLPIPASLTRFGAMRFWSLSLLGRRTISVMYAFAMLIGYRSGTGGRFCFYLLRLSSWRQRRSRLPSFLSWTMRNNHLSYRHITL